MCTLVPTYCTWNIDDRKLLSINVELCPNASCVRYLLWTSNYDDSEYSTTGSTRQRGVPLFLCNHTSINILACNIWMVVQQIWRADKPRHVWAINHIICGIQLFRLFALLVESRSPLQKVHGGKRRTRYEEWRRFISSMNKESYKNFHGRFMNLFRMTKRYARLENGTINI